MYNKTKKVDEQIMEPVVGYCMHQRLAELAGEYHRLSEVAPMGCIPVMEDFMDVISRKECQDCVVGLS